MADRVTTGGPEEFRRWRKRIAGQAIPEHGAKLHRAAHQTASDSVISETPVGNASRWKGNESSNRDEWKNKPPKGYTGGRARGSWLSSVNFPILTEPGTIDPNGAETMQKSAEVAAEIPFASRSYVASAVPYMLRLNNGWSKQTPADFIDRAMDRVGAKF